MVAKPSVPSFKTVQPISKLSGQLQNIPIEFITVARVIVIQEQVIFLRSIQRGFLEYPLTHTPPFIPVKLMHVKGTAGECPLLTPIPWGFCTSPTHVSLSSLSLQAKLQYNRCHFLPQTPKSLHKNTTMWCHTLLMTTSSLWHCACYWDDINHCYITIDAFLGENTKYEG